MAGWMKLMFVGNLGGDVDLRFTADGTAVASFSVAVNRKWNGGEETTWLRVSAWRNQAEPCAQYLHKGSSVLVEGRLTPDRDTGSPRIWTAQDGTPRAGYDVTADRVIFLQGNGGQRQERGDGPEYVAEDEIPF